jgi:hypothetical protein
VTFLGALAGGLVGTVVLTSALGIAQAAGLTRMDLPLLLGTIFTSDRRNASVLGYAIHFGNGLAFASLYGVVFVAVDTAGWLFGAALGFVHALFAGGALINILLPAVHPRMGTIYSDATETPILEPPWFMLRNYGPYSGVANVLAHIAYGAIVGGFAGGFDLY